MKKLACIISLLSALTLWLVSCGDGDNNLSDDGSVVIDDDSGSESPLWVMEMPYSLKVAYDFTGENVARSVVMNVTGKNVSGSLYLQDIDGNFVGKLKLPVNIADTLDLVGVFEIPAASGDSSDCSTISLDDLKRKCGHVYTVNFKYKADTITMTDSKAYFHFKMSPCQHWMYINSQKYNVSKNGEVWIAVGEKTPVVTTFYKMQYNQVERGKEYTIDRSGFVDLGIANILWADKNVGAYSYEDYGSYYEWKEGVYSVTAPEEVPTGGENSDLNNDFRILRNATDHVWDRYNGVKGTYFYIKGHTDWEKDPFVFLPAAGSKQGESVYKTDEVGEYWSSTAFTADEYYRFYFDKNRVTTDGRLADKMGKLPVRPIMRGEASNNNQDDISDEELVAAFCEWHSPDVNAWFTYKDYQTKEVWAVYFYDDTYVVSQRKVRSNLFYLQVCSCFSYVSEKDDEFKNFEIEAIVWHLPRRIKVVDGKFTFMNMEFTKEEGPVPKGTLHNFNNENTSILYFPWDIARDGLTAWYKQKNPRDELEDFMALYIYKDGSFDLVKCNISNGEQSGSSLLAGKLDVQDIQGLDFGNMTVELRTDSGKQITLSVQDNVCTITGYKGIEFEKQDNELFWKLRGIE